MCHRLNYAGSNTVESTYWGAKGDEGGSLGTRFSYGTCTCMGLRPTADGVIPCRFTSWAVGPLRAGKDFLHLSISHQLVHSTIPKDATGPTSAARLGRVDSRRPRRTLDALSVRHLVEREGVYREGFLDLVERGGY